MKKQLIVTAFALLIAVILLGINIASDPLEIWDESRNGTNAVEMMSTSNPLVTTFQGADETWNTKPPLLIWAQAVSMKIFGVNELAIRLPSLLSGAILASLMLLFVWRMTGSLMVAVLPFVMLLSSHGFTGYHCIRNGDYDAMLSLFLFLQVIAFSGYLNHKDKERNRFRIFLVFIILAVLTKGIQGLFLTPVFGLLLFLFKKNTLREFAWVAFDSILAIGVILAYYFGRDYFQDGYLNHVWQNELGGRLTESIDDSNFRFGYYLELLWRDTNGLILLFAVLVVIYTIYERASSQKLRLRKTTYLFILSTLFYIIVIGVAQTKMIWYHLPVVPILFTGTSLILFQLAEALKGRFAKAPVVVYSIVLASMVPGLLNVAIRNINDDENVDKHQKEYRITNYLRALYNGDETLEPGTGYFSPGYEANNWWYIDRLNDLGGDTIGVFSSPEDAVLYDRILMKDSADGKKVLKPFLPEGCEWESGISVVRNHR